MRAASLAMAVAGVGAFALAIVAGGRALTPETELPVASVREQQTAAPPRPETAAPPARVLDRGMADPVTDERTLQRVAPRPPLSELSLALPPDPGKPEPRLLYRPVAVAAGRIEAQGHVIELPGIEITEADRKCRDPQGRNWSCGMIARTAFRNWLRGRAIECTVAEIPAKTPVSIACRLGDQDVAEWLVRNGYAEAVEDGAYSGLGEEARKAGRGIFGDGPPG